MNVQENPQQQIEQPDNVLAYQPYNNNNRPGWQTNEFQHQYYQQQDQKRQANYHPPNPNNFLGVGNNRELAQDFLTAQTNYRQTLPQDNYLIHRGKTQEQREAARNAEREQLMHALNIDDENEYNRRQDLARRLRANQIQQQRRAQNIPVHHLTDQEKYNRAAHAMYPRIITDEQYYAKLNDPTFKGEVYPHDERTVVYPTMYGKTLNTLTHEERSIYQKVFGELVGLLGFQPEFHAELLTKASAKIYLRDEHETKYRYELFDMDDDYRTPGTLWIYKRGDMARNIPEEIYAIGGYIVGKSATSKQSLHTLRDMDYYNTYPTREERHQHNKREFSISNKYLIMKPVPELFKMCRDKIEQILRNANRVIPDVGTHSYIVFHDDETKEPIYNAVCKITRITWNAILSRITQLFLIYYIYPQINSGVQIFEDVKLPFLPPNNNLSDNRKYLYNRWKTETIHPEVEKRILDKHEGKNYFLIPRLTQTINSTLATASVAAENLPNFLPKPYIGEEGSACAAFDCLTSVAVLYFTNNLLKLITPKNGVIDYATFERSHLIFRLCTKNEFNLIEVQAETGETTVMTLTSKSTLKVYQEQGVRVRGNEYIEDPRKRIDFSDNNINNPIVIQDNGDDDNNNDGNNNLINAANERQQFTRSARPQASPPPTLTPAQLQYSSPHARMPVEYGRGTERAVGMTENDVDENKSRRNTLKQNRKKNN